MEDPNRAHHRTDRLAPRRRFDEVECTISHLLRFPHPALGGRRYGEALLHEIEQRARKLRLSRLFVLTTRTAGWFVERGFVESDPARLPKQKRDLYNWQRRSLVYEKTLT